jgi:activator of 2-hydroxyglutaryl-CoA dehydratase
MNDKCAAGTGRFLEVMALSLGIPLEEFPILGAKS